MSLRVKRCACRRMISRENVFRNCVSSRERNLQMIQRTNCHSSQVKTKENGRKRTNTGRLFLLFVLHHGDCYRFLHTGIRKKREKEILPFAEKRNNLTFTLVLNQIANGVGERETIYSAITGGIFPFFIIS